MRCALTVLISASLFLSTAQAQTFQQCADINEDSVLNVADFVDFLYVIDGSRPLPAGRGDVDFHADVTLGDFRYISGFIFSGFPEGGCPPFPAFTPVPGDDTLFMPVKVVAAGSGSFVLPIFVANNNPIGDLLLPLAISGLDSTMILDSIKISAEINTGSPAPIVNIWTSDSTAGILLHYYANSLEPGIHLLANAYFHYTSSPGATVSIDTTTVNGLTAPGYIYGPFNGSYTFDSLTHAIPQVVTAPTTGYPNISLDSDTLKIQTLAGYPNPDPVSFSVLSDGGTFSWFLSAPDWLLVDKTSGLSGETVNITADISGLGAGTYYGDVIVFSTGALGSPKTVTVVVDLKQQFPALDANCDGIYTLADIIIQINYIFKNGPLPCNPCTGEPPGP